MVKVLASVQVPLAVSGGFASSRVLLTKHRGTIPGISVLPFLHLFKPHVMRCSPLSSLSTKSQESFLKKNVTDLAFNGFSFNSKECPDTFCATGEYPNPSAGSKDRDAIL